MEISEMVDKYHICDAVDGTLAVYACVTDEQAQEIRECKPQILAYLQGQRAAAKENAQAIRACADNIPGVRELRAAASSLPASLTELKMQYPDAAFVLDLETGRKDPCYEYAAICHRAYRAICDGENIGSVRIRHEKDLAAFLRRHTWD